MLVWNLQIVFKCTQFLHIFTRFTQWIETTIIRKHKAAVKGLNIKCSRLTDTSSAVIHWCMLLLLCLNVNMTGKMGSKLWNSVFQPFWYGLSYIWCDIMLAFFCLFVLFFKIFFWKLYDFLQAARLTSTVIPLVLHAWRCMRLTKFNFGSLPQLHYLFSATHIVMLYFFI